MLVTLLELNSFQVELLLSYESYQNKWIKQYISTKVIDHLNSMLLGSLRDVIDKTATDFILVARRQANA
jgi:hypothetical protein